MVFAISSEFERKQAAQTMSKKSEWQACFVGDDRSNIGNQFLQGWNRHFI